MKLLIILNDLPVAMDEYQHTGTLRNCHKRAVEIQLTNDQILHINKLTFEEIESVSIQLEYETCENCGERKYVEHIKYDSNAIPLCESCFNEQLSNNI